MKTGEHWVPDSEHYDTNKLNGLVLPRVIRTSHYAQKIDVVGCDPLQVPLSKFLYQQTENFWLRRIAHGREAYVTPMGEVSHAVFVSELLSQLRSRQINLDLVAQHKASFQGMYLYTKMYITYHYKPSLSTGILGMVVHSRWLLGSSTV